MVATLTHSLFVPTPVFLALSPMDLAAVEAESDIFVGHDWVVRGAAENKV